jgi:hypothetical protein
MSINNKSIASKGVKNNIEKGKENEKWDEKSNTADLTLSRNAPALNDISPEEKAARDAVFGKHPPIESNFTEERPKDIKVQIVPATPSEELMFFSDAYADYTKKKANQLNLAVENLKDWISEVSTEKIDELFRICLSYLEDEPLSKQDKSGMYNVIVLIFQKYHFVFKGAYPKEAVKLIPLVERLNRVIDFSGCPRFSIDPRIAIYGVRKEEKDGSTFLGPLDDSEIENIVDALVQNGKHFQAGEWIKTVLGYVKPIDNFGQNERDILKKHITEKLSKNADYRKSITKYLFSNEASVFSAMQTDIAASVAEGQRVQRENEQLKSQLLHQKEDNTVLNSRLTEVQNQLSSYYTLERECSAARERATEMGERLELQRAITEDIEREKQRALAASQAEIAEMRSEIDHYISEIDEEQKKAEDLLVRCQNLSSDLEVEREKVKSLNGKTAEKEAKIKQDIVGEFVYTIKDQINHFLKSFAYFKQCKEFDEDTVDICLEDINDIIQNFSAIGATPIGQFGQVVDFDLSKHHCEEKIAEGTHVRIVNIGWAVSNEVIAKAEVEGVTE